MFIDSASKQRLLNISILASLLLLLVLLQGPRARAQSGTLPPGTYTGVAPNNIPVGTGTMPSGEYQLTFLEGGKFEFGVNGTLLLSGTFNISQNQVELTLPLGVGACAATGVYQWSLQGNKLTFAPAAGQTDACIRRGALPAIQFFKTDQLDNLWNYFGPDGGRIKIGRAHV